MKFLSVLAVSLFLLSSIAAEAAGIVKPTLDLEMKIAYGQGRFGALYATCGKQDQIAYIGGSLANWRAETLAGYHGHANELSQVEAAFDAGAAAVNASEDSCDQWDEQAANTAGLVSQLAQYGDAAAAN